MSSQTDLETESETDYQRIAKAITYITENSERQPSLDEIAAQLHLSPFHFQRLFTRWAGVSPKRYLQALTVERGKALLKSQPVLQTSNALGLSSSGRLYDHFVQLEALTPGEYQRQGQGLCIRYAMHETPFGWAFLAQTPRGICHFSFLESAAQSQSELQALQATWPAAEWRHEPDSGAQLIQQIFQANPNQALSLHVRGTNFQIQVWKSLLRIPPGQLQSYGHIAKALNRPKAARAIGQAVGANPVAFLIPCHRVIQQSGHLGGYRWGTTRKQALHIWESARYSQSSD